MQQSTVNRLLDVFKKWLALLGLGGHVGQKEESDSPEQTSQIEADNKFAVRERRPSRSGRLVETNHTDAANTAISSDDDDEPPEHTMDQQLSQQAKNENVNDLRPPMPGGAKKKVMRNKQSR